MSAQAGPFDVCAAMGRWEVAAGRQLAVGDRVVLDRRAVDEYLALEGDTVDWEHLDDTADTVCSVRTRRGSTTVVLQHTVGRICHLENEVVLRRLSDHDQKQ